MKDEKEFYKKFKPQLSPKRMLELGVFGGAYFVDGSIREFPKSWFSKAKLSKTFDVNLNRFKIESGLSRKEWIAKGWIFKEDPLGWFQWYCRFKNGRRKNQPYEKRHLYRLSSFEGVAYLCDLGFQFLVPYHDVC